MPTKTRPNEPCPCGSGKKFKKCCGEPGVQRDLSFTESDRANAFERLEDYVGNQWGAEDDDAFDEFWGELGEHAKELPDDMSAMSSDVFDMWLIFDRVLEDGSLIIEHFLEDVEMPRGERSFLEMMRSSRMRLYQVTDVVPGVSLTLRDTADEAAVTVNERSASQTVEQGSFLAARIVARGCSGAPEMERGLMPIVRGLAEDLVAEIRGARAAVRADFPEASADEIYRPMPPIFHEAWISSIFDPQIPQLANTDGDPMVAVRVSFHVDDVKALRQALTQAAPLGISRADSNEWTWVGDTANSKEVSLATARLSKKVLTLEANSVQRGERARAFFESVAGPIIRHRRTTHEELHDQIKQAFTDRALGRSDDGAEAGPPVTDEMAALIFEHLAKHYRAWIDAPVPALDGRTPRDAAKMPEMAPRVAELIEGIENLAKRAEKDGQPAYDVSWMWAELGLARPGKPIHNHPPRE